MLFTVSSSIAAMLCTVQLQLDDLCSTNTHKSRSTFSCLSSYTHRWYYVANGEDCCHHGQCRVHIQLPDVTITPANRRYNYSPLKARSFTRASGPHVTWRVWAMRPAQRRPTNTSCSNRGQSLYSCSLQSPYTTLRRLHTIMHASYLHLPLSFIFEPTQLFVV